MDTGATSHVTKFTTGGINQRKSTIKMKGWMNNSAAGTYEMDIPVRYCDRDGNKLRAACLTDVQVNERFNFNLFSITKMLLKGYQLKGDKKSISIWKGKVSFVFVTVVNTKHGALFCAIMKRPTNEPEVATASVERAEENPVKRIVKTSVKRAHECLGHMSEAMTRAAATHLGMALSCGSLAVCKSCAMAKAQQRNVPKVVDNERKAKEFNGRVMHDLAKIKVQEEDGYAGATINKSNWHLLVDEVMKFKKSKFFETKGEIVEYIAKWMHGKKEQGHPVQVLRMDNSGENVKVVKNARGKDWKLTFNAVFYFEEDASTQFRCGDWIHGAGGASEEHDECSADPRDHAIQAVGRDHDDGN